MMGYVIYNPPTDQYWHPVEGWLSVKNPEIRVYGLRDCIRWTEENGFTTTEIHCLAVTSNRVSDETVEAEKLAAITEAIEDLPAWIQDCLVDFLDDLKKPYIERMWTVDSDSGNTYTVSVNSKDEWECDCPDFTFRRRKQGTHCKHIHAVHNRNSAYPLRGLRVRQIP